jgi:WD40 repeat protein
MAASAGGDETVRCWDLASGGEVLTLSRHPHGATSVAFLPDDSGLVSCGNNGRVAIWNIATDDAPEFKLHEPGVTVTRVLPDGLSGLSAGADARVVQFDVATGRVLRRAALPNAALSLAISDDQRTALVGGTKGMLQRLDLTSFAATALELPRPSRVEPLVTPAPATAAASLTTVSAAATTTAPTSDAGVTNVLAVASDGSRALVGTADNLLYLLDFAAGDGGFARRTTGRVLAGCFTADGRRALVVVVRDLLVIDLPSGRVVQRIPTTSKPILAVAMSPDGKTAVTAGYDDSIRMWDLESGLNKNYLLGHLGPVRSISFMGDGHTLVSGSDDQTVHLFDVDTARDLRTFTGHRAGLCAVSSSRDGGVLVSADRDGVVRVWDLRRPRRCRELDRHLDAALASLDRDPGDAASLVEVGRWYAFRGRDDWAIDCLTRARSGGAAVSPLLLARSYWRAGRAAEAAAEFRNAITAREAPADYLNLCLSAVER